MRKYSVAVVIILCVLCLYFIVQYEIKRDIQRCERDSILFNRTTSMISGSCYVLMDDGVWLPQTAYWYNYYLPRG